MYIRRFRIFLDFKVSRYCEGYSFWSVWGPSILVRAFWNFKRKVLKYSRNCSLLITNFVKPLTIHLLARCLLKFERKVIYRYNIGRYKVRSGFIVIHRARWRIKSATKASPKSPTLFSADNNQCTEIRRIRLTSKSSSNI